jgi:asparagine synthase (glutamine-hydrolysing)
VPLLDREQQLGVKDMCGIAGIYSFDRDAIHPDDRSLVDAMLNVMPRRGPDARGVWAGPETVLGHLRLSIIDLCERSNQPMVGPCGRTLVFNGEIYNYLELRRELSGRYEFRTESDSEVILAAYDAWGPDCLHRFNGDWALAIYDPRTNELFLARDRYGIKPLYYATQQGRLLFASEVRALLAAGVSAAVSPQAVYTFICNRKNEWADRTLVETVKPLPRGHCLLLRPGGEATPRCYYGTERLLEGEGPSDPAEALEQFGELLTSSVMLRLRSDVPVGVCLSGGMDSSAIVACASRFSTRRVATYSASFPNSPADENRYARLVARAFKTKHKAIIPKPKDFLADYDKFMAAQDTPHASPAAYARYKVIQRASRDVTVLLDGQGGDEIFGGYSVIYKLFREHYEPHSGVTLRMDSPARPPVTTAVRNRQELAEPLRTLSLFPDPLYTVEPSPNGPYVDSQYALMGSNLLSLLHTEDRMTMAHSMEGRVPFLDHRLVEFCFRLPVHLKMQEYDKHLLRQWALGDPRMPRDVAQRTDKKGFSTWYEDRLRRERKSQEWLRERLGDTLPAMRDVFDEDVVMTLFDEMVNHDQNHLHRLLAVLSVCMFFQRHNAYLTPLPPAEQQA